MITKTAQDGEERGIIARMHPAWRRGIGGGFPLLAAVSSFLPWLHIGVSAPFQTWTAYTVTPLTWVWLVLDAVAFVSAGLVSSLQRLGEWRRRFWRIVGAVSLGVGLTIGQAVGVSARVSTGLGAPNPVHVAWGVVAFLIVTALWTVAALIL